MCFGCCGSLWWASGHVSLFLNKKMVGEIDVVVVFIHLHTLGYVFIFIFYHRVMIDLCYSFYVSLKAF